MDQELVYKIRHDPRPRGLPDQDVVAVDLDELVAHLDEAEVENYVPMFFDVNEDRLEFWDDENIANMLGPLNLLEEL